MDKILNTIIKWAIPVIFAGMLTAIGYLIRQMMATKRSMALMLRSQIVGKVERYMEKGYFSSYAML